MSLSWRKPPSAAALMSKGYFADAKAQLHEDVKRCGKSVWLNIGLYHLYSKEYVQARACFLEVYRIDQSNGFAVGRLIELAAVVCDLQDAEHWCDVLSALPDCTVSAIIFRARALSSCGRALDALRLLNDGLVAHPEAADLHIAFDDIAERAIAALCNGPRQINRVREIEGTSRIAQCRTAGHHRASDPR